MGIDLKSPPLSKPATTFRVHIARVVRECSEEQVRRISAFRVVAFVKNILSFWNRPEVYFPRSPVGRDLPVWLHSSLNHPVSERVFRGEPLPAVFGLNYFSPKAICERPVRLALYGHTVLYPYLNGGAHG